MLPVDQHYTPPWLAARLAEILIPPLPQCRVGDFSAGDGELLRASLEVLEDSVQIVARDSDPHAIAELTRSHPDWDVSITDVFAAGRRLADEIEPVDRLILNPPFSYRGAGGVFVEMPGLEGRFSPAMSFLVYSLGVLKKEGQCVAILPASILTSEKDSQAITKVEEDWGIRIVSRLPPRSFPGVSASVVLVEIGGRARGSTVVPSVERPADRALSPGIHLEVVRGCTPVHRVSSGDGQAVDFLHSTGLRDWVAAPSRRSWDASSGRFASGPFIAIPRVGQLTPRKVCVFGHEHEVLLSDCVIALKPGPPELTQQSHSALLQSFESLKALYGGSCAPYLTIARLVRFLESVGFDVCPVSSERHEA